MSSVFLVSCKDVQSDADNVYLQKALAKRDINVSIVKWEDHNVDYAQPDLVISRTTSNYVFTPKKFFKWVKKSRRNNTIMEHKQDNGMEPSQKIPH